MNKTLRETILWVGAGLGSLCLVWTVAMFAFGLTPLVFTSGSMSPAIGAGDLGFATTVDGDEIAKGDIVSVIDDRGTRITHRATQVDRQDDGGAVLQLKGDANQAPDEQAYNVDQVERVLFSVPKAGYVVNAVGSPFGMFLGGLLVMGVLVIAFRRNDDDHGDDEPSTPPSTDNTDPAPVEEPRERRVGERARRVIGVGVGVGALVAAGTMAMVQPTSAAFNDTAGLETGSLGAASVQPPASLSCTNGSSGNSVNLVFPHRDTRYDYTVTIVNDETGNAVGARGGNVTGTGAAGANQSMSIARDFTPWGLFELGAVQYTARVSSRLKTSSTWTSSTVTTKLYETRSFFGAYRVYCGIG